MKRSGVDHTVFTLQTNHTLPSPRKRSPDGATHLITVFNVRQSYCARYSYWLDVRPSVRPSHAGIVSK